MTHNTEQERVDFECTIGVDYDLTPSTIRQGQYAVPVTQAAWYGWQAARRAPVAPVQLPEPFAYVEHHKAGDNLWFDCPGGKYSGLYTEHQVLAILAQHGIKTK